MKLCPSCRVEKDASEFGVNKRRPDGLACYCRACARAKANAFAKTPSQQSKRLAYYETNRAHLLAAAKKNRAVNGHKHEAARQHWASEHRDEMLAYYSERGTASRKFIDDLKTGRPCLDCERTFAPYVMEWDHVRGVKRHNIGMMSNHRRERILEEIAKCDLVCCACHRIRSHARRSASKNPKLIAFRSWMAELKAAPCLDCQRTLPSVAMDFDHVHGEKLEGISQMWSWSREKVLVEIEKCELVCANCHRERTVQRLRAAALLSLESQAA